MVKVGLGDNSFDFTVGFVSGFDLRAVVLLVVEVVSVAFIFGTKFTSSGLFAAAAAVFDDFDVLILSRDAILVCNNHS